MAIQIKTVEQAISKNGLKALVHAPAGTGKTVLGATAKEKTLLISAESGLLSLGQEKKSLIKKGSPDFAPEFCDVVEVETLQDLGEVYLLLANAVEKGEAVYSWVVLDSITEIAEVVLAAEMAKTKDPRKAYGELIQKMTVILKEFRDLQHYNILMTCKQQRVTDDVSGVTYYIPVMPGAKLAQSIPYLFDEVWCLRIGKDEGGKNFHYIQAVRDNQYEAKDRSGKLTDCEPPSLAMLYEKIYGDGDPEDTDVSDEERYYLHEASGSVWILKAGEDRIAEDEKEECVEIDFEKYTEIATASESGSDEDDEYEEA
jgi:hypothetical protein